MLGTAQPASFRRGHAGWGIAAQPDWKNFSAEGEEGQLGSKSLSFERMRFNVRPRWTLKFLGQAVPKLPIPCTYLFLLRTLPLLDGLSPIFGYCVFYDVHLAAL